MANHRHNCRPQECVLDGRPSPLLTSSTQLWAIMLRNSSELFISQSTTRKFLDTLEDLLTTPKTSPVVRERLLNVVAAAAYASGNSNLNCAYIFSYPPDYVQSLEKDPKADRDGFRGLWRKVKPLDKPDEVGLFVYFDPETLIGHAGYTSRQR